MSKDNKNKEVIDEPIVSKKIQEDVDILENLKDDYRRAGTIAIRPYVNSNKENMGLENYGYVVFPGTHQMEDMACVMFRGKLRYLNGLDEFAASVQGIDDKEKRAAKILQIRTIVSQLERRKLSIELPLTMRSFGIRLKHFVQTIRICGEVCQ